MHNEVPALLELAVMVLILINVRPCYVKTTVVSSDIYVKFYTEMEENIEKNNHKKIVWKKNAAKEIFSTQCDKEVAMLMDMACKKTSLFCPRPAHFMLLAHFLVPITVLF